jgi:Zn-dependent metalloprotease
MNKINSPRKSKFTLDGRLCRPNFAWLGLMLLFLALFPLSSHAQRISKQEQLQALCEPMENIEFFHFKNELNITREKFLSTYLELLDLAPQSEMRFVRTHTNDIGVTSTFYQQYLNGYKIKGAEMVINERNGMVQYVNGRYLQQSPTQSTANISAETALQTAFAQVESKDYLWKYPEAEEAYRRFKKDPTASYLPKES